MFIRIRCLRLGEIDLVIVIVRHEWRLCVCAVIAQHATTTTSKPNKLKIINVINVFFIVGFHLSLTLCGALCLFVPLPFLFDSPLRLTHTEPYKSWNLFEACKKNIMRLNYYDGHKDISLFFHSIQLNPTRNIITFVK